MDRNERQNSFMNSQNSRGKDKKIKKYRTRYRAAVTVAVLLLFLTGFLGVQNYMLRREQKNESAEKEQTDLQAEAEQESETEETQQENSPEPSETEAEPVSETPAPTEEPAVSTAAVSPTETPATAGSEPEGNDQSAGEENANEKFAELSTELDEKIKEKDVSYQIKGLGIYETASCGKIEEAPEGLQEYAELCIMGGFYNRIGKSGDEEAYIRDNEGETDLSGFILAMTDRANDQGYTDENGQAGKEILLRLGESPEHRDSRIQNTGYTDKNSEGYEEDLEKGAEQVNEYIRQVLGDEEPVKTIDKELNNNLTLADCETVFAGLLADGDGIELEAEQAETMRQRLSTSLKDGKSNSVVSAIPWDGEQAKNRIWISGQTEDRATTVLGVMDPESGKGYILSVTGTGSEEDLKDLSDTVFQKLIGSNEQ